MSNHAETLLSKIEARDAQIGIIGLGYVGLPLALAFAEKGFEVLGFDVDPAKVEALRRGDCYIKHIDRGRVAAAVESERFWATTDFDRLDEPDVILICVPTPLGAHREPDMRYVEGSAWQIRARIRPGQLVVLESTTYPGTTDEMLLPILSGTQPDRRHPRSEDPGEMAVLAARVPVAVTTVATGSSAVGDAPSSGSKGEDGRAERSTFNVQRSTLRCGFDFFLAFSPEREDPGNPRYGTTNTPKVVGGVDQVSGDLAEALYAQVMERTVRVASARVAEASKLMENIFRAVNIALVNELKIVFERMGIDVWDVLDAAETKPFGFMRFNPGPGLGGHCVRGDQWLRVRGRGVSGLYRAEDLYRRVRRDCDVAITRSGMYVETPGLESLSLDAESGEVGWRRVRCIYRGRQDAAGTVIETVDNRRLVVTDEHPMLARRGAGFEVVPATDLAPGDELPVASDIGADTGDPVVDLIDVVPPDHRERVWVRLRGQHWADHERLLKDAFGWEIRDSIRKNSLRLDRYLAIENRLPVDRSEAVLATGRGKARREWPSSLQVTPDIARLVGYYLAEGCITRDGKSIRVRWTFNRSEHEYIEDVRSILDEAGFPTSVFNDRQWHSTTIKLSSLLFGWLLADHWGCGTGSNEMRIPDVLFGTSWRHKRELLRGLLRGDGDVWVRTGTSTYRKNDRTYTHNNSTAVVGYFSSSPALLEQVVHLLQDLGFRPRLKRGSSQIRLQGARAVDNLVWFFDGEKKRKLETAIASRRRRIRSESQGERITHDLTTTGVRSVRPIDLSGFVYSLEVEGAESFTTNTGIVVHNCIPLDPFYLAWKAREHGVSPKFIELAGEVNTRMPEHVVEKLGCALNEHGKAMKGARILVLGLAYKPDIDDPRESPAFEIIELLLGRGAEVSYHDPHIPVAPAMRSWPDLPAMHSVDLTAELLAGLDAAVIVTNHRAVDYDLVLEHAPLILDTRGVLRGHDGKVYRA